MSDIGDAISEVRAEMAVAAPEILPDLCDVTTQGAATTDDYGNTTRPTSTGYSDLPCKLEALSVNELARAGGLYANATHVLTTPAIWEGAAVTVPASASVTVKARSVYAARACTVVGQLLGSNDLWLRVAVEVES